MRMTLGVSCMSHVREESDVPLGDPVKKETKTLLRSKAAQRSGVITGSLLLVLIYGLIARHRRLERIEEKLDEVVDEVADEDD
jgi:hypothetical protein